MSRILLKFAAFWLIALLCVPGIATAQKGGIRKPTKKQEKQPTASAVPAYTPAPLQPLPLDQVPAVEPHVSYTGGELTIEAHNSTLADVLKSVRQETGAELEIPPNATERVVADIGPGRPRDVLAELLNGTHFNYVIVGSSADPTAVQSIFLTPKTGAVDAPTTALNRPGVPPRGFAAQPIAATPPADTSDNDSADDSDVPDDQPAAATDQSDQQNQNGQQTPKTPEQLLQELQRQQQQQQQQQQPQQNPQNAPPQGILPNQPPTVAPANPNKPD